ncbi:unnamed protein product [Arctia plantaginis]|uniref:Uncharacterized protein n=1 Tax=Arctia plantaginis TaxID=874455 RepID=A0A8S1B108_ARCPL|nr:unnamed protein product [Arctia plantaginis]
MDESGIDMGFDLASLLSRDFSVDQKILEEMTAGQQQQDFMFYELKSKAVPITESSYEEQSFQKIKITKIYKHD